MNALTFVLQLCMWIFPVYSGGIGGTESQQHAMYPQAAYPYNIYPSSSLPKPEIKVDDSDDEHLVVDETPRKKARQRTLSDRETMRGDMLGQAMDSGSLRLKLSSEYLL